MTKVQAQYHKNWIREMRQNIFFFTLVATCGTASIIPCGLKSIFPIDHNTKINACQMGERMPPTKIMVDNKSFYCILLIF